MAPSTATLSARVHLAAAPARRVARTQRPVARSHRGVRVSALSVGDKVRCCSERLPHALPPLTRHTEYKGGEARGWGCGVAMRYRMAPRLGRSRVLVIGDGATEGRARRIPSTPRPNSVVLNRWGARRYPHDPRTTNGQQPATRRHSTSRRSSSIAPRAFHTRTPSLPPCPYVTSIPVDRPHPQRGLNGVR